MENVDCVARPIADSSLLWILAMQNVILEGGSIDPIFFVHHAKSRIDPPWITNIWQFLRSTIEPSFVGLPFAEPLRQQLLVESLHAACDFESAYTAEDIGSMGFGIGNASEWAIEVPAA